MSVDRRSQMSAKQRRESMVSGMRFRNMENVKCRDAFMESLLSPVQQRRLSHGTVRADTKQPPNRVL